VQDGGRYGAAHLGVPRAGPLDAPAARLANRLVGSDPNDAVLETTLDGVGFQVDLPGDRHAMLAVTGAPASVRVSGRSAEWGVAVGLRSGSVVEVGAAISGVRSYVAVSGGLHVPAVLGSRSTDTLSGLGPPVLADGQVLGLGAAAHPAALVSYTVPRRVGEVTLHVRGGPDDEWFAPDSVDVVAMSHLHFDHVGALVTPGRDGELAGELHREAVERAR